jgi:AcrR family transcriptional regulator
MADKAASSLKKGARPKRSAPAPYGTISTARRDRKEQTRNRLLDAACTLYTSQGFEHTSVDQIAEQAGVSRATFYLHFSSHSDVLDTLRAIVTGQLNEEYDALAALGPQVDEGQLFAWMRRFMQICRADRKLVFILIRTVPAQPYMANARSYYQSVLQRLGSHFPRFAQAAEAHGPEWAEAMLLMLQLEAMIRHFLLSDEEQDLEALCIALARNFHQFIHSRQQPAR